MEKLKQLNGKLLPIILAGFVALVASGIGGLIVNYGWSKAIDVQILNVCKTVDKLEGSINVLFKNTADNTLTNVEQREQIKALREKVYRYEKTKGNGQ